MTTGTVFCPQVEQKGSCEDFLSLIYLSIDAVTEGLILSEPRDLMWYWLGCLNKSSKCYLQVSVLLQPLLCCWETYWTASLLTNVTKYSLLLKRMFPPGNRLVFHSLSVKAGISPAFCAPFDHHFCTLPFPRVRSTLPGRTTCWGCVMVIIVLHSSSWTRP